MNIDKKYSFIKIMSGSDLSKRRLPYMLIKNDNPGPALWLTGCMHGDEIGGTVVIHRLFNRLRNELRRGSVHAFPLMNPMGFENVTRSISISNEDLNRSFPGSANGNLAERIANIIFGKITDTNPDLVLDLHNDWNNSIPYILLDLMDSKPGLIEKIKQVAAESGLVMINDTDRINTSLTYNLIKSGIPALTLELGESFLINDKNVEKGVASIWRILSHLGMVENNMDYPFDCPDKVKGKILNYYYRPLSANSGIIHFLKKPGEIVKKKQKIARIYNAFGKVIETLESHHDAVVLGHADYAVTYPGAPVMAFGVIEKIV